MGLSRNWIAPALYLSAILAIAGCGGSGGGSSVQADLAVASTLPANGAEAVDPSVAIQVSFNTPVSSVGVAPGNVRLTSFNQPVAINLSFRGVGNTLVVTPASPLRRNTPYVLTIQSGATSDSGGVLRRDVSIGFTTDAVGFEVRQLAPPLPHVFTGPDKVAAADLDGDGRPDLVTLTGLPPSSPGTLPPTGYALNIFMQAPNGQFVQSQEIDSIVGSPIFLEQFAGVALMDVDGDGLPEIVVPEYKVGDAVTSGLRIFKRDLAGQFHAVAFMSTSYTKTLTVADVNGDGRPDLIGTDQLPSASGLQVFINTGSGLTAMQSVSLPLNSGDFELAVADVGGDGQRDIVVNYRDGLTGASHLIALTVDGSGAWGVSPALTSLFDGVCAGVLTCRLMRVIDVNGDGRPDFVFLDANHAGVVYVKQPGAGYAFAFGANLAARLWFVTDVNADGILDLLVLGLASDSDGFPFYFAAAAFGTNNSTFRLTGTHPLSIFEATFDPASMCVVDLNSDGLPDLVYYTSNLGLGVIRQLKD